MNENSVLTALQTGWLSVEAFGQLRRYARHGKPPSPDKIDANRRFNFCKRDPNLYMQLIISLQELKTTSARLIPELPPPIPDDPAELLQEAKKELDPIWKRFEDWSNQVWNILQIRDPVSGQAFTCGGDLADTYWYAQGADADKLAEMLRSYRTNYMAERLDDLSSYLPENVAQAIQHSLGRWSIGERIKDKDEDRKKYTLERLESQSKVWRDLLFGLRRASSYLTTRDQRWIASLSAAASAGLVILVGLLVLGAVLLLSDLGHSLMGSAINLPADAGKIGSDLTNSLVEWQNWSAIIATVSSVLAVFTGVIKGLSGWLWAFHQKFQQALTLRYIKQRTYRDHGLFQKALPVGNEIP